MNPVAAAIDRLEIAPALAVANLAMYPLLLPDEPAPSYVTLDEALAAGLTSVTEVSESGRVPELLVKNQAPHPVLILDGEELVGTKQNRIVNLTILVAPAQTTTIPVSCVEAGRWAHRSREFAAAGRTHYASGRARKLEQVSHAMRTTGLRLADQGEVWQDIDDKASRMQAPSPTHAAAALYEGARTSLDAFLQELRPLPRQAGAIFAINGRVAGLDLFDSPVTWQKSMRKLVESYGLDALDVAQPPATDRPPQPKRFLTTLKKAPHERFPAVGIGEDLRITGRTVSGGGLVVNGTLVHLVAFPAG